MQSSSTCICCAPVILTCQQGLFPIDFPQGSRLVSARAIFTSVNLKTYFAHSWSNMPHFAKLCICFEGSIFYLSEVHYKKISTLQLKTCWVKQWFSNLFLIYDIFFSPKNILCRSWIYKIETGCSSWSQGVADSKATLLVTFFQLPPAVPKPLSMKLKFVPQIIPQVDSATWKRLLTASHFWTSAALGDESEPR